MPITGPTLIDVVEETTSADTIVLVVPGGGVPQGATIFVDVNAGTAASGCADDGGNTYDAILADNPGGGANIARFQARVSTALSAAEEITVTLPSSVARRLAVAYYFEGLADAAPLAVQSTVDTSRPSEDVNAGDLALGLFGGQQDSGLSVTESSGFGTINGPAPSASTGFVGSPRYLNSASRVPGSNETTTYDPTVSDYVSLLTAITVHAQEGAAAVPRKANYYRQMRAA